MSEDNNPVNLDAKQETGFTIRAFIIGILFVILIAVVIPYNYILVNSSRMSTRAFPMGAGIVLLLCIFIGNMLMKKFLPRATLRAKEILVIMVMSWIALAFPGIGWMVFVPTLGGPATFGTSTNKYFDTLFKGVDAVNVKDLEIDKVRSLTKEELYDLRAAFLEPDNKEPFEREYYRVRDSAELERIYPEKSETYEQFLSRFIHAKWDMIVPYDTVEIKSMQGPTDELYYFFNGFPPRYNGPSVTGIVMSVWFKPLMLWAAFLLGICIMSFCIMTILRKQWVEKEKLLFPITKVPLELVEGLDDRGNPLLQNKLLWIGVALPVLIGLYRYFAFHTKLVPEFPQGIPGGLVLPQNVARTFLNVMGIVVGFTYLVNLDISFSLWFFHLLGFLETGLFNFIQFGTDAGGDAYSFGLHSYVNHQSIGGAIAFVIVGLLLARKHLWAVFRKAFGAAVPDLDDKDESISYRAAVFGLLLATLFCTGWLIYTGMTWWVALGFLGLGMILYIGVTRVVCEGGVIFVTACMVPQTFMLRSFGAQALGFTNLALLSIHFFWMGEFTSVFMPNLACGMKLADTIGPKKKKWLFLTSILIILIIFFVTGAVFFNLSYNYNQGIVTSSRWFFSGRGVIRMTNNYAVSPIDELNKIEERGRTSRTWYDVAARKWPFDSYKYENAEKNTFKRSEIAEYEGIVKADPKQRFDIQPLRWGFTIGGFIFMTFLMLMRSRFLWWPFHPIGFPFSMTDSTDIMWFSIFIGWLFKMLILKYGGVKLFNKLKPVFIGLIVGSLIIVFFGFLSDYILFPLEIIERGCVLSGQ